MDALAGRSEVPELLPARMLNAYAYCHRLFYLEWVQARFAENADVAEGRYQHRAVDREEGRAPLPAEDDELKQARSVTLSSDELGLIARLDIIEGEAGRVRPVDVKKGKAPDTPAGAYESDLVQLAAQGLLLREAGFTCDEGVVYFAASRRRVTVLFDDALMDRTKALLLEAREAAARHVAPLPLVDSPKCPRCSLVGICLPDETNTLTERVDTPPRRMLPRDDAARPLYVGEQGAYIGARAGRIEVSRHGETLASLRPIDVSQVCVYGNVQVSTQAMRAFFAREVPVCYFSYGGWFTGMATGLPSKHVELRRRQVIVAAQGAIDAAKRMIVGKIANSRTLLRRNAREVSDDAVDQLKRLQLRATEVDNFATLLGVEGAAARIYFGRFAGMLRPDVRALGGPFDFAGRNRRPPRDPVNCLLSFTYGLLVKDLTATCVAVGFDPYIGLYHQPRFGRPALALDLAEEFRPLVADSVVVNVINNGEITESDFIVRAGGVALTEDGRRAVIRAYERRMDVELIHPWFQYKATYRRLLEVQARILGAFLLGEVPEYAALVTR